MTKESHFRSPDRTCSLPEEVLTGEKSPGKITYISGPPV